jgi:hypothetical protein
LNRINAMRETEASFRVLLKPSGAMLRAARLAAVAIGIGLMLTAGVARAGDDEEDDSTFEEKIIKNIMTGLGGTNMENAGIEYRERSPLVVPPRIDLPPPAAAAAATAPNWPKDPDEARRKAAIAAAKKSKPSPQEASRLLTPAELAAGKTAAAAPASRDVLTPGANTSPVLSPSQLGFTGFGNVFGGNKVETAPFTGEPSRDSLTQPPTGYQTPSPNYAYGTGPKESLNAKPYNPAAGQYGE